MRTEDAYQRRGLGRALLTEGIRRLMALGAMSVKITRKRTNDAARSLSARVGFADVFVKLAYARETAAEPRA